MADSITCNGCDATWTGISKAHCGSCHRLFSGLTLFDKHRHNRGEHGGRLDPADMLVQTGPRAGQPVMYLREGTWSGPELDEATKRARFGAA